jgi:hypothetical protein
MKHQQGSIQELLQRELARIELELTDIGYLHAHDGTGFVGAPLDIHPEPGDLNEMGEFDSAQETNKAVAIELVTQMKSIERALERAAKGTYGICSICGADIEKERLAAYLSAETCMDCA